MINNLSQIKLACVIPTHNRKKELFIILKQISQQEYIENINLYVIVVVDGSTDGTVEMININYPSVHIVLGDGNWWYTKSMNKGFKYANEYIKPDVYLTMNDDTEISSKYVYSIIKAYKATNRNSIVGSVSFTISIPNKIISSGKIISNHIFHFYKSYIPEFKIINTNEIKNKVLPSIVLPGRGMLIPSSVMNRINYFDEKFKQYHSDEDFCLRAKKANIDLYISWDAHVYVHEKLTGAGTSYIKENVTTFISNLFNNTSRNYLPDKSRMIWRHKIKILWPVNLLIFIIAITKNYYTKQKL